MRPAKRTRREVKWSCPWSPNDLIVYSHNLNDWKIGHVVRRRLTNDKRHLIITIHVRGNKIQSYNGLDLYELQVEMINTVDGSLLVNPSTYIHKITEGKLVEYGHKIEKFDHVMLYDTSTTIECVVKSVESESFIVSPVGGAIDITVKRDSKSYSPVVVPTNIRENVFTVKNTPQHVFFRANDPEWEVADELLGAFVRIQHGTTTKVGVLIDVDYQDGTLHETIYCWLHQRSFQAEESQHKLRYYDYHIQNDTIVKWITKTQITTLLATSNQLAQRERNVVLTNGMFTILNATLRTDSNRKKKLLDYANTLAENGDLEFALGKLFRYNVIHDDLDNWKTWKAIKENILGKHARCISNKYSSALDTTFAMRKKILDTKINYLQDKIGQYPISEMSGKYAQLTRVTIKERMYLNSSTWQYEYGRKRLENESRINTFQMNFLEMTKTNSNVQYDEYLFKFRVTYSGLYTRELFSQHLHGARSYVTPIMKVLFFDKLKAKMGWANVPHTRFFTDVAYIKTQMSKQFKHEITSQPLGPRRDFPMISSLKRYQNWLVNRMFVEETNEDYLSHFFNINWPKFTFNAISGFGPLQTTIANGGLLCLGTGLGKTVISIELMKRWYRLHQHDTTLIVTPLSLIDQWKSELAKFAPELDVGEYYGRKPQFGTVTLTTYGKLRSLAVVNTTKVFDRVIFDESHKIKNPNTQVALACGKITARARWCLSATPSENLNHLQTQLMMLQIKPFHKRDVLYHMSHKPEMYHLLRRVVFGIDIRTLKEMNMDPIGTTVQHLPPQMIDNSEDVWEVMTILKKIMMERMDGNDYQKHTLIRFFLTQLQIAVVCPTLLPLSAFCEGGTCTVKDVQEITKDALVASIQGSSSSSSVSSFQQKVIDTVQGDEEECTCVICFEPFQKPTVLPCLHMFCHDCIARWINSKGKCPLCKVPTAIGQLKVVVDKQEDGEVKGELYYFTDKRGRQQAIKTSTKALLDKMPPPKKFEYIYNRIGTLNGDSLVVFSAYSVVLTKLHAFLKAQGCQVGIITGKTSRKHRERAICGFMERNIKIFLLSTNAAAVGINLQAGAHIIFMEPSLNDSVKEQAIGRLQRIGQTKNVTVTTLCCQNSYESLYEVNYKRYKEQTNRYLGTKKFKKWELIYRKELYYNLFHELTEV